MPPALTYPGVYIEELSSGVHTITGVATSIAVFIGWATKGPTDEAALVLSFAEFERTFGTLNADSLLGFSVNHFFANGGQQAYIVRMVATDAATATAASIGGQLTLFARNPGVWGNAITANVIVSTVDSTRFTLQIQVGGQVVESFSNLSVNSSDKEYVVAVVENDSSYVTFVDPTTSLPGLPALSPTDDTATFAGGDDGTPMKAGDGVFETALTSATGPKSLLDRLEIFNLLCVPGETDAPTIADLQTYCKGKRAFYIVDCPKGETVANLNMNGPAGLTGTDSTNSAFYFPWVKAPNPLNSNRIDVFPPCGFVAGNYARTDVNRGVWKAPAGIDASLTGAFGLEYTLSDAENGLLNPKAINCLREFKVYGDVVWGARTLRGDDQIGSEWKYVPVRRTALFLESSLYNGTKWVVFEPNDEKLWGQIRMNVGAFMQGLFQKGAFQGSSPSQAYFVKCDGENNPQASINLGVVNILVGFAPLKPAEFVVIQIQQIAGQI